MSSNSNVPEDDLAGISGGTLEGELGDAVTRIDNLMGSTVPGPELGPEIFAGPEASTDSQLAPRFDSDMGPEIPNSERPEVSIGPGEASQSDLPPNALDEDGPFEVKSEPL